MENLSLEAFRNFFVSLANQLGQALPGMIAAIFILVVGWIIAKVVSVVIDKALRRLQLRRFLFKDLAKDVDIEGLLAKGVYYLIMLFVLVAFFHKLDLPVVTEPLTAVLDEIMAYLPNLISAFLLFVVALVIASLVRFFVIKLGDMFKLDEKISQGKAEVSVTQSLAVALYWFVILLFIPGILSALKIEGLVAPVQTLVSEILSFLPNIFASILIFIIGWFVARIIRQVITSLLVAIGIDRLTDKLGIKISLSSLIGTVVYILVLIPVLISSLDTLQIEAISAPAIKMLNLVLNAIPIIMGAIIILAISYIIGKLISGLVKEILQGLGVDSWPEKIGVKLNISLSEMVSYIIMGGIMLFALMEAADILQFEYLTLLISKFIVFASHVLLALILLALGLFFANLTHRFVLTTLGENQRTLANLIRIAIIVLVVSMALTQIGVGKEIVITAFTIIMAAIGIAVAIAFGIGGKDAAAKLINKWLSEEKY